MFGIEELQARIKKLEERMSALEEKSQSKIGRDKARVLDALDKPMTPLEMAQRLRRNSTWTALLLKQLETEGRVSKEEEKGGQPVYARTG
ncbi:MAG: hypothetical protein JXB14_03745 [Candidatus Altiarchaeota archaeon]|nr:hypothetical protein [Candidatus Altiarchaeota archaeon]